MHWQHDLIGSLFEIEISEKQSQDSSLSPSEQKRHLFLAPYDCKIPAGRVDCRRIEYPAQSSQRAVSPAAIHVTPLHFLLKHGSDQWLAWAISNRFVRSKPGPSLILLDWLQTDDDHSTVHTQRNLSSATRNIKYTSRDQVEYMTNEILLGHRPIAKTQLIIRHKLQTQYYYPCRYSQEWSNDDLVVH